MTAPRAAPAATPRWYVRPAIMLPIVAALIVLSALIAPQAKFGRTGDARLTTYSTEPQGARLFYELTQRLGWNVEQRQTADFPAGVGTIVAVLDPVVPLRSTEVHALLERVRRGGALLAVPGPGGGASLVADSLHLAIGPSNTRIHTATSDSASCARTSRYRRLFDTIWPGDIVQLNSLVWKGPRPDSVTLIVALDANTPELRRHPMIAAAGFPYGHGRIVVGADPDLLRNDALRVCTYGLDVAAVRMLEYLSAGGDAPRTRVVFDEYHQGYGEQHGSIAAIAHYLVSAPSGRLFFQLLGAGLVLLVAAAPRSLPPRDSARAERRSPLEHVDALGRAYAQVGATRSASVRLIRGVRRRVAGGASPANDGLSDDAFLDRSQRDAPALAGDISLIRNALHNSLSRRDFALVGAALERLELSLTRN